MDLLGQTSLLVGVTSFALGLSVLARNVRNKLFLAFAALTWVVSGWALSFFMGKVWGDATSDSAHETLYRWHLFFNLWIAPAALSLIRVMVRIQDRLSRQLLAASTVLALGLSGALVLGYEQVSWVKTAIYFLPVLIVPQILQLMWSDRTLKRSIERLPHLPALGIPRRDLIYLGALFVLATSLMDHVQGVGEVTPVIGNLILTAYLFFLSQAVLQQRLLNIGVLFSRFLVLLAVALTLTAVYSMLFAWIQNGNLGLFFLNSFIVSFMLLTLLDPIRTIVAYSTQRLLTQTHRRLQEMLRDAQRRLAGILEPGTLFQAILQIVDLTLQPQWTALFVLRSDGTKYRRVRFQPGVAAPLAEGTGRAEGGMAQAIQAPREVIVNHPLLQYCERLRRKGELPIVLDQVIENEIERSASRVQREHLVALIEGLKAFKASLLIPLFDGHRILGFLTVMAPQPPEAWSGHWGLLSVIYPYFEEAAQTLRNMEIYVRQREKERLAALGEMAAGLAHEIRNPLGAIKGAAQFLEPSEGADEERPDGRFLKVIVEEVDRLNRVVTQFLDYSKPPTVDFSPVSLEELGRKTVDLLAAGVPSGVRIEFIPPRAPARVMGNPGQLHQVLLNLIQNGVEAVRGRAAEGLEAWVKVSIEADAVSQEVVLIVEDNGHGIKRENVEKLFIPFFTTSPQGTGLGLSISQKIIEAHRGRIEVASEEGRFTRFFMILPALIETKGEQKSVAERGV